MNNLHTQPPRYGVRKNPTTGKMESYELPAPVDLARSRKELHDKLHNGGWFEDPLAAPKPVTERPATDFTDGSEYQGYMYGNLGDLE